MTFLCLYGTAKSATLKACRHRWRCLCRFSPCRNGRNGLRTNVGYLRALLLGLYPARCESNRLFRVWRFLAVCVCGKGVEQALRGSKSCEPPHRMSCLHGKLQDSLCVFSIEASMPRQLDRGQLPSFHLQSRMTSRAVQHDSCVHVMFPHRPSYTNDQWLKDGSSGCIGGGTLSRLAFRKSNSCPPPLHISEICTCCICDKNVAPLVTSRKPEVVPVSSSLQWPYSLAVYFPQA